MDKFFIYLTTIIFSFLIFGLYAQESPVYNHYYNNAFLYNPAEAGSNGYTNTTLNYRQQWYGIEGAPTVSTLTFETPFDLKQWAIGLNFRNFERGLLTTTHFSATYAYSSHLSKTTTLHFGISAGVVNNSINIDKIDDTTDPILNNFMDNNMQLTGRVGIKLSSESGFNLGVSLPTIFQPTILNDQNFNNYEFSPFNELLFMGYFKKKLDKKTVVRKVKGVKRRVKVDDAYAPLQFYAIYNYAKYVDQRIELLTKLDLNENVWVGGAYRFNYGFAGLVGFQLKKFNFSYAYEPASKLTSSIIQGTHEFQLGVIIGDKKQFRKHQLTLKTVQKKEGHSARFNTETSSINTPSENGKKYYVVLKTFSQFEAADHYQIKIKKDSGISTDIYHNKKNNKFYVYIFKTTKNRDAKKELKAVEELTKFKRVQIIEIE